MIRVRLAAAALAVGTSSLLLSACGGATEPTTQEKPAESAPAVAKAGGLAG